MEEWNNGAVAYPQESTIHQLFEEQVNRTPDAVAVVDEKQQLTYRELNEKANQLAHYLQQCGIGTESLVGICFERSVEMIVSIMGIWKAGQHMFHWTHHIQKVAYDIFWRTLKFKY